MKLNAIDHLCFAVQDLDEARRRYEEDLGLELDGLYVSHSEKIRVARYYVGGVALELIAPTSVDSEVAKFLRQRGEGFYLISYRVDDVDAALAELRAKGVTTIDQRPRCLKGNRYAFVHSPRQLSGVLTEVLDGEFDYDEGEHGQEAD
ncbi:MAG TPA: VOC family protein [Anaerolineae bacterium]|nr:VOC family protein [Anaerolineae bacterium]